VDDRFSSGLPDMWGRRKKSIADSIFCPVPPGQGWWIEAAKDDFINMKGGLHYAIIWQILTLNCIVQSSSIGVQRLKSKEFFLKFKNNERYNKNFVKFP
jgi:hypothetical protein